MHRNGPLPQVLESLEMLIVSTSLGSFPDDGPDREHKTGRLLLILLIPTEFSESSSKSELLSCSFGKFQDWIVFVGIFCLVTADGGLVHWYIIKICSYQETGLNPWSLLFRYLLDKLQWCRHHQATFYRPSLPLLPSCGGSACCRLATASG